MFDIMQKNYCWLNLACNVYISVSIETSVLKMVAYLGTSIIYGTNKICRKGYFEFTTQDDDGKQARLEHYKRVLETIKSCIHCCNCSKRRYLYKL